MKPREPRKAGYRAFELDLLRGFALFMMMLHHFIYDLRYVFGLDVFAFQERLWFVDWIRAPFVMVFLSVSGICSTFTRSNAKRGLRLLLAALLFTAATTAASLATDQDLYILFNVLHLLSLGTLLYAAFEAVEKRASRTAAPTRGGDAVLLVLAGVLLYAAAPLERAGLPESLLLLPLGLPQAFGHGMADYMPIVPWMGFFLIGVVIGRTLYATRTSAFPAVEANRAAMRWTSPFRFIGRHAMGVYILHQPAVLAVLFLLRALGAI